MNAALIRHVYQRAGGICEHCHLPARFCPLTFHVDHITPRQHGGSTEPDNLALACLHCNRHKGPNLAQTNTVRARDTSGVQATIGDGPGSIYVESLEGAIQKFVPVYINTSEIAEPATAGSDETPPVLPVNTPINAVSNESWLTITGESGGAITFSFAATTVAKSAVISVLGQDVITQNIVVSQAAPAAIGASAGGARVRERAGRQVLRSRMELVNGLIAGRCTSMAKPTRCRRISEHYSATKRGMVPGRVLNGLGGIKRKFACFGECPLPCGRGSERPSLVLKTF